MMGHKICLFGEIWKIISKLYLLLLLIWSSVCRIIISSRFGASHERITPKGKHTCTLSVKRNSKIFQVILLALLKM